MGEKEKWSRTVTAELTKRAKMKATTDIEKSRKKNKVGVHQECNENQPRGWRRWHWGWQGAGIAKRCHRQLLSYPQGRTGIRLYREEEDEWETLIKRNVRQRSWTLRCGRLVPDEECPWGWSDVSLLSIEIYGCRRCYRVDVWPQEDNIYDNIDDFEENTIFPGVCHCCGWSAGMTWHAPLLTFYI